MSTQVQFKDYSMGFKDDDGKVYNLIDHLNMQLDEGKALGIVGESGCGKSMTSLSLMRLLPAAASVQGGEILLNGEDLLKKSEPEMEKIRGKQIAMIFQEPMTALNPVMTIGKQIGECLKLHHPEMKEDEIRKQVCEALNDVGIANPETRIDQYPHEFSGGMRQRVMIAMAIINHPAILIADEPTTALDVTIQAQILDIMRRLKGSSGSLMLITHNLGIVADICEEVVVMYAGRAIERGTLKAIFDNPLHPYTQGLMASVPTMRSEKKPLYTIPGTVPTVYDFIDVSHCGSQTAYDAVVHSTKPIIMSHTGAKGVWNTKRLASDELIQAIAAKGGVVGIEAAPHTTMSKTRMTHDIDSYMEHFEYVKNLVGIDHVGFGVDCMYGDHVGLHHAFAAALSTGDTSKTTVPYQEVPFVKYLENPTEASWNIPRWLIKHGYTDEEIIKVLGGNAIRVLREVWS